MKRLQLETSEITGAAVTNQLYIQKIRQRNEDAALHTPRYLIKTYGCQMNEHDSEKLSAMLELMGYQACDELEQADLIIYNTCCVRENAELKVYGNLGALKPLKQKNSDLIIAVCGCMMQQSHVVDEIKKTYRHVDLIFGTHNLHCFPEMLNRVFEMDQLIVDIWQEADAMAEGLPVKRARQSKAFVNIIYGCDNYCTYCIVPYTRGRIRSRAAQDILREIEGLIEDGVKEITLLGQNVNAYGQDLAGPDSFASLLTAIDQIAGSTRIRFMTPHPKDFSKSLIDVMSRLRSVCQHVHLPVQAGSDRLLKKMNRKYSVEQYIETVDYLRHKIPDVAISTDIIIGFPGEEEEDVDALIALIERVRYDSAFTFIYSPRVGTPAATMPNQIDDEVKHRRFERMLASLNAIVKEKNKARLGERYQVLIEGYARDGKALLGRTPHNFTVTVKQSQAKIGDFITVEIDDTSDFSLFGKEV